MTKGYSIHFHGFEGKKSQATCISDTVYTCYVHMYMLSASKPLIQLAYF